jgi:hypothetical protein
LGIEILHEDIKRELRLCKAGNSAGEGVIVITSDCHGQNRGNRNWNAGGVHLSNQDLDLAQRVGAGSIRQRPLQCLCHRVEAAVIPEDDLGFVS